MIGSALLAVILGLSAGAPFPLTVLLSLLYGAAVVGDSAALTAGVVKAAPPGYQGTTLAIHSTAGFGAAVIAPLAVGLLLDAFGADRFAWVMGFACMGAGSFIGALLFRHFGRSREAEGLG
jgi:MFS family permease